MNAATETHVRAPVAAPHPTHKLKLLLKREFWEHKGGFLWAPLVAGGIFLLLSLMGFGAGEVMVRKAPEHAAFNVDGGSVRVNGVNLAELTSKLSPEELQEVGDVINVSLFMSAAWPLIVLGFVAFFYCLGCLYDERKDRSVLFWKSLPISDRDTVLSKVISVGLVAPVLAVGAALATMIGFMVLLSAGVLLHGGNPFHLVWGPADPIKVIFGILMSIPVYALWALPTIGWLMLCSVWARSKPFLWAIIIPVFAGIFVSWFDVMELFNLDTGWFWANVPGRLLLGLFPGIDLAYRDWNHVGSGPDSPDELVNALSAGNALHSLGTPEAWVGAVFGAAMIYGAIRLRRWRDEG